MGKIDLMKMAGGIDDKRAQHLATWMDTHSNKNLGLFLKEIIQTNDLEVPEKVVLAFILGQGSKEKFKVPNHG